MAIPEKLSAALDALSHLGDRSARIQALIDLSEGFEEVPPRVARRPFSSLNEVPACESEAYMFEERLTDGTLAFHFAVENPQGVSARALAKILGSTLSGAPAEEVAEVQPDIIYKIFGNELSMGKSMGLLGMVGMVQAGARRQLESRPR